MAPLRERTKTETPETPQDPSGESYAASSAAQDGLAAENDSVGVSPILILLTVSLACAAAALVSGSYALWLARQNAARQTLTDVQAILRVCRERMRQMEDDLSHLPPVLDSARI